MSIHNNVMSFSHMSMHIMISKARVGVVINFQYCVYTLKRSENEHSDCSKSTTIFLINMPVSLQLCTVFQNHDYAEEKHNIDANNAESSGEDEI